MVEDSELPKQAIRQEVHDSLFDRMKEQQYREFLERYQKSDTVTVPCRNGVYPQWNHILAGSFPENVRSVPAQEAFLLLDIPEERLKEVYEYGTIKNLLSGKEERGFTGNFTPDGKQKLADTLGKTVEFYRAPDNHSVYTDSKEVYQPQSQPSQQ